MIKYAFSNKRDITGAFPISSRRAANTDWKLFDIHDDDGSETLSARSRPIFPQDEDEMREVPKRSKRFWENKGRKQNKELEQKDEISSGHIEEQENEREHEELQEDKTLDQSEVPEREQFEKKGQEEEQEPEEHEESQGDKTPDQDGVLEQEQKQENVSKQHGESQEDESLDQDKDNWDKKSKLRTVPELVQPTPADITPKHKARKLKGRLVRKMLEDSRGIMKVEDPRESDIVIP